MGLTEEQAAEELGCVRKDNFLAHTIRDLESKILKEKGKMYQIQTYKSQSKNFNCDFFDHGCTIRIPANYENMQDGEIRVRLAHELGHIVRNIDKLDNPEFLRKKLEGKEKIAEEIYSWKFAYLLIQKKSREYDENVYKKFVYKDEYLAALIQGLIKDMDPEIYRELDQHMPFTH